MASLDLVASVLIEHAAMLFRFNAFSEHVESPIGCHCNHCHHDRGACQHVAHKCLIKLKCLWETA